MKWAMIDKPDEFRGDRNAVFGVYNAKPYVLVSTLPDQQLVNGPGINRWGLESAMRGTDEYGAGEIEFNFDPQGVATSPI